MNKKDEALKLALDVFEHVFEYIDRDYLQLPATASEVIVAIREALKEPEQEPLFWYRPVGNDGLYEGPVHNNSVGGRMLRDAKPNEWEPLYTSDQLAAAVVTQRNGLIAELEADLAEQCRINGIGSERETKLLTRIVELETQLDAMNRQVDCSTCANRGSVVPKSDESYCQQCVHGDSWKRDHYKPKEIKRVCGKGGMCYHQPDCADIHCPGRNG